MSRLGIAAAHSIHQGVRHRLGGRPGRRETVDRRARRVDVRTGQADCQNAKGLIGRDLTQ